jgi:phytol kinase
VRQDWLALITSYVYVFAIIGIGEGLRKWLGQAEPGTLLGQAEPDTFSTEFTRKLIHISVGMWAFGTVLLFQHWHFAIIPPLSFVVLNYLSHRYEIFKSVETGEKGNLGTVYFPISFAIIVRLFWTKPNLLVASLMPMTWGDALAAILGRRYGQRKYSVLGTTRSVEGSLAMFLFSWLSTFLALLLLPPLDWQASLLHSLALAVFATLVEALSPWHIDNLTVSLLSAALLYLMG